METNAAVVNGDEVPYLRNNSKKNAQIEDILQNNNGVKDGSQEKLSFENNSNTDLSSDRSKSEDEILGRSMSMDKIRNRLQQMEKDLTEQVSHQVKEMISEVMEQLEKVQPEKLINDLFDESSKTNNKKKSSKPGSLPEKEFLSRNSPLTDLFKIKHIRAIYHIFIVIFIILFINTAVYDIVDTGSTNLGVNTIMIGFGKLNKVFCIWLGMMLTSLGVYLAFSFWANQRVQISPGSMKLKIWDYGWLISLIAYQISFIVFPVKALLEEDLPPASSLIILMEQVRLMMKIHAFVRSAAPRTLNFKPHTEKNGETTCPEFSKFLYFLFCPTLIYRDSYPRTNVIRWRFVLWHYTEVIIVVFAVVFLFERLLIPVFKQFGTNPLEPGTLVLSICGTMMPAILAFLSAFYCLLHSWMNASAELLRFADRMFYKDWWNATSYSVYFRTWNIVIHDWLYSYIYKDMYELVTRGNKIISTLTVFTVSAIFHEYILAFAFRFFYPALFVSFAGVSLSFVFLSRKIEKAGGNVFIWLTLCLGVGVNLSLYSMEFYARINCPAHPDKYLDLIIPRSWTCHNLT
ncbi:sterol O-acyltransferase 1 [Athalia rosae]|uniref:sterol O-acyltransferase 1 n=1 Tax=Athalia rosae TaxID=37344 RepID=UPI0020339609|nr:sterol O-acyltransferase 1 [Athalia rosae]